MCVSVATRRYMDSVMRDLPIPASPESNTSWPSPALACSQRSSSRPTSWPRPTNCERSALRVASKRLTPRCSPVTMYARMGSARPFTLRGPRAASTKRSPTIRRVESAMTTLSGPASASKRAARFGVSPTTLTSRATSSPTMSPTTTAPVATPTGRTARRLATAAAPSPRRSPGDPPSRRARRRPRSPADSRNKPSRHRP